jgi:hypothetical protein
MPHRQAYFPRLWPCIAVGLVLAPLGALALDLNSYVAGVFGGLLGLGLMTGRIAIWKRRHPVISIEDWLRARREASRWN